MFAIYICQAHVHGGNVSAIFSSPTYGSVSAGREFWPFRVIFFQKVERLCGQTVKDRFDFSIDPGQLGLVDRSGVKF